MAVPTATTGTGHAQFEVHDAREPFEERHYSVSHWASLWGFSAKTVREWFSTEVGPGILRHSNTGRRNKQDYVTRLAEALGLGIPDALVMEFRFRRGYSREDLLSMPVSKKTRLQFQAAWRRIAMRFDEIRSMLLHNPEREAWNVRMESSARFHNRPWSTAGRKQPIQIPERSYKLNGLEAELAPVGDPDRFANENGCGRELMRDGVWLVPQAEK